MKNHNKIQWNAETNLLSDLKPFEKNPRTITESQYRKLVESLDQDGYHSRIKVTIDHKVIGGHQRIKALKELGILEVEVLKASRELTECEYHRILLRDNHNNGLFDADVMSEMYDLDLLHDIGLHDFNGLRSEEEIIAEAEKPPASYVRCPECAEEFPAKGNKV